LIAAAKLQLLPAAVRRANPPCFLPFSFTVEKSKAAAWLQQSKCVMGNV
jgi:hypothetical protein